MAEVNAKKKGKGAKNYFKEVKNELRKVVWPDREALTNHTITVLAFAFFTAAIIMIFDFGVLTLFQKIGFLKQ